jgi:hypothetical protein
MKPTRDRAEKKPYVSPTVIVLGDIEAITLGNADGDNLDADFPIHTKKADLGFS